MERRVSGGLLLVLALLAVVVVPKILNPPRLAGVARIAPPPPPLVVGDCIASAVSGYTVSDGALQTVGPTTLVPCTEPHGGEIVHVEGALAPSSGDNTQPTPFDAFSNRCWVETVTRWRPTGPPSEWWPQLNMNLGVVGPDDRQAASGQQWVACSVGRFDGTLDQPLAALAGNAGVPPEFGSCSQRSPLVPEADTSLSCTERHNQEDFGYRELAAGSTSTQDDMVAECTQLIARSTGRDELLTEASLRIETEAWVLFASGESDVVTLPMPPDADRGWVSCAIRTIDDRELTASLRRIGDAPLPWAP